MCNECDFEYGELIEVSHGGCLWHKRNFYAFQPNASSPFVAEHPGDGTIKRYLHARRPLPDIKPGQPILVRHPHLDDGAWELRWFSKFEGTGVIASVTAGDPDGSRFALWELLNGFDYTKDPEPLGD